MLVYYIEKYDRTEHFPAKKEKHLIASVARVTHERCAACIISIDPVLY